MPTWSLAALICAAAGLALIVVVATRGPKYRAKGLMTDNEREFHGRLARALPPGHALYPQVPILALLEPSARRGSPRFRAAFRAVANRRVDWIVEGESGITVVELDDRTHDRRADAKRDRILAGCGYRVIRYESRAKPSVAQIRGDLGTG